MKIVKNYNETTTFKAQKGSKDIVKIVHVRSVVEPECYEATTILFCAQRKQKHSPKRVAETDWREEIVE